jgi:hypothetical protein
MGCLLKLRVSVVPYRDFYNQEEHKQYEIISIDKRLVSILDFTDEIDKCELFLGSLEPICNDDNPEDVAGGYYLGL